MTRGEVAVLVPSQITEDGIRRLEEELTRGEVKVLGNQGGLVFAQWDDKARHAVPGNPRVRAHYLDKIGKTELARLTPSATRVATLWNWRIDKSGRSVTDAAMKQLLKSLQLESRQGEVYDLLTKKSLGKIERGQETNKEGNWPLSQQRTTETWPCPGFSMVKLQCVSLATPSVCSQIIAEVFGPKHYAFSSQDDASSVKAYTWSAVWWWEGWQPAHAFSYGLLEYPRIILRKFS
jgi:hypothetical protein